MNFPNNSPRLCFIISSLISFHIILGAVTKVKNVYQKQGFQILGGVGCYLRTNYFLFISFDCKPHVKVFCCVVTVLFLRDFFFFEMLMLSQCEFIWSAPFLVLFLWLQKERKQWIEPISKILFSQVLRYYSMNKCEWIIAGSWHVWIFKVKTIKTTAI